MFTIDNLCYMGHLVEQILNLYTEKPSIFHIYVNIDSDCAFNRFTRED